MVMLQTTLLLFTSLIIITDQCAHKDFLNNFVKVNKICGKDSCTTDSIMSAATNPSYAVMLYEPLPFLKPFHQEKRTFTISGHLIHIHQMWDKLGVAAVVWDAAIVLTEYLEQEVSANRLVVKNRRIIELGAGTGLVSIATALLGGNTVSTDREDAITILEKNIQANLKDDLSSFRELISVEKLDWGENLQDFQVPFDLILGADIIYIERTFEKLLATIKHLSTKSTRLLLSCRIRYDRDLRFLEMLRQLYQIKIVHNDKERGIDIYEATSLL